MNAVVRYFALIWELLTSVNVPGTDMSFAVLYVGIFVALLAVAIFRAFLGIGYDREGKYYTYNRFERKRR